MRHSAIPDDGRTRHSVQCVLVTREMDGDLDTRSDGIGQDASFILEIPIEAPEGK